VRTPQGDAPSLTAQAYEIARGRRREGRRQSAGGLRQLVALRVAQQPGTQRIAKPETLLAGLSTRSRIRSGGWPVGARALACRCRKGRQLLPAC